MANKAESRGRKSASGRKPGSETANASRDRKQPASQGRMSPEEQRSSRMGGKTNVSRQSVAEMDDGAPSRQTSTAQDESGQV